MSAQTTQSRKSGDDDLEHAFDEERRKKIIIGIAVLVLGAIATLGILYYFGAMSAVGW